MKMKYQYLLQSLAKFTMKKFTQLLLASISLFSFLFSYYSLNLSFSSFPSQLLSHALDKNYVFLICNGIFLVLLACTSSEEKEKEEEEEEEEEKAKEDRFLNEFQEDELPLCVDAQTSYLETSNEEVHVQREDEEVMSIQLSKSHQLPLNIENSELALVKYKQDEAASESQNFDEEKEEGGIGGEECSRTYEIVVADNCEENNFFPQEEEEVEVEESDEPYNKLSTEELNKKFEEFIRKMKEEIRIEARQQLVLVK